MFSTWYTLTQVLRQNKNHVIPCPNQIDLHQSISNQFNTNPSRITNNIPKYPRHPKAIPFTNHRPSALLEQQGESQVVQAQTRHAAVAQLLPRSHWNCATCPTCPGIPKAPPVPSKTRATPLETRSKWRNDEMIWWYLMWLHEDLKIWVWMCAVRSVPRRTFEKINAGFNKFKTHLCPILPLPPRRNESDRGTWITEILTGVRSGFGWPFWIFLGPHL